MPVNRIVALLTPVFATGAAVGSAYLAKWGLSATAGQVEAAEIAGATTALAPALSWLKGHQAWEARAQMANKAIEAGITTVTSVDPKLIPEIEAIVKAKAAEALQGLEVKVTPQAPASAPSAPAA